MAGEWQETMLGQVIEFKRGYDLPQQARRPGGVPLVSSSGVTDYHSEAKVKGPGIVTGRYGTLGQVFYIPEDFWPLNTTLYVRDFKGNDPRFISYFLRKLDFLAYSDKAAVPGLNRNHLHQAKVLIPTDVIEQRAIAQILEVLDDKIELNRRMSRTLEAVAQAIFRAWFVDFDPVKAKAAGAASFSGMPQDIFEQLSDQFVQSQHGPIPKGWEVRELGHALEVTMGQSPPSEFYNQRGEGLPFHQGVTDYGHRFPEHRVSCTQEARLAEPGDVLLSVRAPVGRINVADRRLVIGRGLAAVRHPIGYKSYTLYLLKHIFAEEDAVGDGTIYKAITKKFLLSMPLVSPPASIVARAESLMYPFDELVGNNEREIGTLIAVRDGMLPKLVSGEIRVPAAELADDGG